MSIREWGTGGAVVVGGVIYGVSQGGLGDALSQDVRHISEVSYEERAEYMEEIVGEFSEAFQSYLVETEDYIFVGESEFRALPAKATFVEVVTEEVGEDGPATGPQLSAVKSQMASVDFCGQEEMTMLTEKGWTYHFSMTNSNKRQIYTVFCRPDKTGEQLVG